MLRSRGLNQTVVCDKGPPEPAEPVAPVQPEASDLAALVRYKYALADYERAYGKYLADKREFDAFGGEPKYILQFASDAKESVLHDPNRYSICPPGSYLKPNPR